MMYRGFGYGYGAGGGLFMLLFGALVLVAIVLLVVWVVRASSGHRAAGGTVPPQPACHEEAVAIAKRRLASGEITAEQYNEIIHTLGG
jgi:uncharacterized membrane protein